MWACQCGTSRKNSTAKIKHFILVNCQLSLCTAYLQVIAMVRVGVVGYGHLGQYLVDSVIKHQDLELAWVWNRSSLAGKIEDKYILEDLSECGRNNPNVIVEVAHPDITR